MRMARRSDGDELRSVERIEEVEEVVFVDIEAITEVFCRQRLSSGDPAKALQREPGDVVREANFLAVDMCHSNETPEGMKDCEKIRGAHVFMKGKK